MYLFWKICVPNGQMAFQKQASIKHWQSVWNLDHPKIYESENVEKSNQNIYNFLIISKLTISKSVKYPGVL